MLTSIREEYSKGNITKHEYIERMYAQHKILSDYAMSLHGSGIKEISIQNGEVIFTVETADQELKFIHERRDATDIPMSFLNFHGYEMEEYNMILGLVQKGDVVLDIGANQGWYSINILKRIKDVMVYSFEPIPGIFKVLKKNFELNSLPVNNLINFGLYKEDTTLDFFFDTENSGASSLADLRGKETTEHVQCKVKKVDTFIRDQKIEKVDFVKCDVEGAELFVFQGANELLSKFKPIVFSEMLRKWAAKFNYHPNDIIDLFHQHGYSCYTMEGQHVEPIERVTEETLATNYLFFHNVKHSAVVKKLLK